MNSSISLRLTSKEEDRIACDTCGKGIYVPDHPESDVNHSFHCNECGARIHLDANVIVE